MRGIALNLRDAGFNEIKEINLALAFRLTFGQKKSDWVLG